MKPILTLAAAAVTAAGIMFALLVFPPALDAAEEAEVRISARLKASGSVEFALTPSDGDRIFPAGRHFPQSARSGVWLHSTPIDAGPVEVRISARKQADGRIEFALQPRGLSGAWGERIFPRGRYFPVVASVGRWLNSTPLALSHRSGLPVDRNSVGDPNAPVTIIDYGDPL